MSNMLPIREENGSVGYPDERFQPTPEFGIGFPSGSDKGDCCSYLVPKRDTVVNIRTQTESK